MRLTRDEAAKQVTALWQAGAPLAVNITGPLGVGKSHLLAELAETLAAPIFDGLDGPTPLPTLPPRVLLGSRRPLAARTELPLTTIELTPWSGEQIRSLSTDLDAADLLVRLSGGLPLLAGILARALRAGADPGVPGALADAACRDVLRRLATEIPRRVAAVVPVISTVDGTDEDLLTDLVRLPSGAFDRIRELSVVRAEPHGLSVAEPFRTLFDLAYTWRRPATRADLAERTASARHAQLARTSDPALRARLADQVLYLAGSPQVRRDLFAEAPGAVGIRAAGTADDAAIGRLIRLWAAAEGLAPKRADRMLDLWLAGSSHGFRVAVDVEDRPVGLVNVTTLDGDLPVLEPLLQQYADTLAGGPGVIVGMMAVEPAYARAQPMLVREILSSALTSGRLIVSTPWAPYQQMSARFGLRRMGETQTDVYRCGRSSAVYMRRFTSESLPAWLLRMQGTHRDTGQVQAALTRLHAGTPASLARLLRTAIDALVDSPSPVDVEAGMILHLYYVRQAGGHDLLAHQLHLSRATYFRRLDHGLHRIAEFLSSDSEPHVE